MTAYYNEYDPYAAQWLRNLIDAGEIADGVVDERSIKDVRANDLKGFTQCHFFAGIGIWSKSLRDAGWDDTRHVWTGSCPCQPFSAAGSGLGYNDERHLWPHFHELIQECRPGVVLGEQVASKAGRIWFDLVSTDLEGVGYAAGAADLCAAGYHGAHIRQRLYWVAVDKERVGDTDDARPQRYGGYGEVYDEKRREAADGHGRASSLPSGVADSQSKRCAELEQLGRNEREKSGAGSSDSTRNGSPPVNRLADTLSGKRRRRVSENGKTVQPVGVERQLAKDGSGRGLFREPDWERQPDIGSREHLGAYETNLGR